MTLEIYEGYTKDYVIVGTKSRSYEAEQFRKDWGSTVKIYTSDLYNSLSEIVSYVNNELGESCEFTLS